MNKKGFTLIELLAVILILGIIALIAIPSVTSIVKQAKDSSKLRSAEGYRKSVENKMLVSSISGSSTLTDGTYTPNDLKDKGLDIKGELPTSGQIIIMNGEIIGGELSYDDTKIIINDDGSTSLLSKSKVYGLKWDGDDHYTRLNDAFGMTSCVGTDTVSCTSDFDSAEIYGNIKNVKVDGNDFVYIPKFYIKKVVTGNTWEWYVSRDKKDNNYYLPECFYDTATNKELPYVLIGKYNASLDETGTKLVSKSGTLPLVNKNIKEFRAFALNNNVNGKEGYQLFDIHTIDALQVLFYIEFGTLNSQKIMSGYSNGKSPWDIEHKVVSAVGNNITITSGAGSTYKIGQLIDVATTTGARNIVTNLRISAITGDVLTVEDTEYTEHKSNIYAANIIYNVANINGQTNNIKARSGSIIDNTNGEYSMTYRGIENLYGNLWQTIDGVNIDNNTSSIYVNRNSKTYASDKIDKDYKLVCYGNCDTAPISKFNTEGFVTKMGYDSSKPFINFPIAVEGSGDTKYGDFYWQNSYSGKKIILFGGCWDSGINGGISNYYLYCGSNYLILDIGSRIVKTAL